MKQRIVTGLVLCLMCFSSAGAQIDLPCYERPAYFEWLWLDGAQVCPELVYDAPLEPDVTALAVGDDGTLYAARPQTGDILAFEDSNGDVLPDAPRALASRLALPHALAWHADALYAVGGSFLYRIQDGEVRILADDVPTGLYWTSAIAIQDGYIYIATSTPCDPCEDMDAASGVIVRYRLDGGGAEAIARGLYRPGDLAVFRDALWVSDSAPDTYAEVADLDEINRVPPTPESHLGFPLCFGAAQIDMTDAFCLIQSVFPAYALPTQSTPLGMAVYRGDAIPLLADRLLVALSGNRNQALIQGFAVIALGMDSAGGLSDPYVLAPLAPHGNYDTTTLNYRNSGFFPRRPLDIAVSPEGWVYISVSGGRILALRPPDG